MLERGKPWSRGRLGAEQVGSSLGRELGCRWGRAGHGPVSTNPLEQSPVCWADPPARAAGQGALPRSGEAAPAEPPPAWARQHIGFGSESTGGHGDGLRDGAPVPWGKAERAGIDLHGK